jgi:hypothetical protein
MKVKIHGKPEIEFLTRMDFGNRKVDTGKSKTEVSGILTDGKLSFYVSARLHIEN